MPLLSPRALVRRSVYLPWAPIPEGRMVDLAGRGSTFVTDSPGPRPDSPTVVLLHAVGCTGLLTWYPSIRPLTERFRVVTLDQRWHGRGIQSDVFSLHDCADDVAALVEALDLGPVIVAGFSMGSIIAQRVWRQHPEITAGLVLCATTDRFRATASERVFHQGLELAMLGARGVSRSRTAVRASRSAAGALDIATSDIHDWSLAQMRSTSPWAVGQAVAALGRHHSRPWLLADRRAHRSRGHPPRQGHPASPPARPGPPDPRRHHPRHRRRARRPACWRPRRSCPRSSRRSATVNARRGDLRLPESASPSARLDRGLSRSSSSGNHRTRSSDVGHRLAAGDDPDVDLAVVATSR